MAGLIQHQQRPQLRRDNSLHVFKDGAQYRVQVEARVERARQLVEDEQIGERMRPSVSFGIFGPIGEGLCIILSHRSAQASGNSTLTRPSAHPPICTIDRDGFMNPGSPIWWRASFPWTVHTM